MENSPFYPTNYEMQKNAVLELFERYKTLRGAFNDGVDLIFLERKVEVLRKNKYLIAVVGQAKSGKSKFINALLGKEIVPTDVKQCTSGIIEIVESKTISLRVKFANGKEEYHEYDDVNTLNRQLRNIASVQEKYRKIPFIKINDLLIQGEFKNGIIKPELLSDTENSGNEYKLPLNEYYGLIKAYAEEYKELDRIPKEISVGHPLGYEFTQMRLVDTPGVEARGGIDKITLEYIKDANAAILIHSYKNVGNSSLYKFYSEHLPNFKKESVFLFLTHGAHLPKEDDKAATLEEAKGLFSEIKDRIDLVDSVLKLLYEEITDESSIIEIRKDEEKKKLIADYILDYGYNNVDVIRKALLRDSNFTEITTKLKELSQKARGYQLMEIVNIIKDGYNQQRSSFNEYIEINKHKIEKTPEEFSNEIDFLKKTLDNYQATLNDFSQQKSKEYKGTRGKIATQFNTVQEKYSQHILSSSEEPNIMKHVIDFNAECDQIVTYYCNEFDVAYVSEMERLDLEYQGKHHINPPKINISELSSKAKSNAYDKITTEGTKDKTTLFAALGGAFVGFLVAGPIGAIIGALDGAIAGSEMGQASVVTEQYNDAKFISNLKNDSNSIVRNISSEMTNSLISVFENYDREFRNKLNELIVDKKSIYDELEKKQNEQVPIYNEIKNYNDKIIIIDSDLLRIKELNKTI